MSVMRLLRAAIRSQRANRLCEYGQMIGHMNAVVFGVSCNVNYLRPYDGRRQHHARRRQNV